MKQAVRVLSTYSADLFGINSVLYELGGMVVMHDASGCNSTYNTHDEPRWYTMDSMIYISHMMENDVILGNDEKLITDICDAAMEEKAPVHRSYCRSHSSVPFNRYEGNCQNNPAAHRNSLLRIHNKRHGHLCAGEPVPLRKCL